MPVEHTMWLQKTGWAQVWGAGRRRCLVRKHRDGRRAPRRPAGGHSPGPPLQDAWAVPPGRWALASPCRPPHSPPSPRECSGSVLSGTRAAQCAALSGYVVVLRKRKEVAEGAPAPAEARPLPARGLRRRTGHVPAAPHSSRWLSSDWPAPALSALTPSRQDVPGHVDLGESMGMKTVHHGPVRLAMRALWGTTGGDGGGNQSPPPSQPARAGMEAHLGCEDAVVRPGHQDGRDGPVHT